MLCIFLPFFHELISKKKERPKKGWTKLRETSEKKKRKQKKHRKSAPTDILESQNPIQNQPSNINLCRSRSPNLQNPLRSGAGRFLQAIWTSRAHARLKKKNYKICDQIKLFRDLSRAVFFGGNGLWV